MKNELISMKKAILLILIGILSFWGLNNLNVIWDVFNTIFSVLSPFILGGVIAFILNIPMTKIESLLKKKIKNKDRLVRMISVVLSLLLFVLVIVIIALLIIPELVENIKILINNIPTLIDDLEVFMLDLLDKYPDIQNQIKNTFSSDLNITSVVSNALNYLANGAIGLIGGLVYKFITIFTAIIFSVYMLSAKEYLVKGSKKVIYAVFSEKKANKIIEIGKLANNTFAKFISGQCIDAIILGLIMFVAFTIFKFPYALIIAVLTTITALIPIFGAIIAMVIGAILIATVDPLQAVLFMIVFQVVQQIEGNFIYPRVVGKSVGLSPLWTLLAVVVGGNLFGVVGMLVGLPLASIVYAILKEIVNDKLKNKKAEIV